MGRLFAGTSGFAYTSWKPGFYPAKLAASKFLGYYATRLNSVEANFTFRRLATGTVLSGWIANTPENFTFAPKAHQKITHFQRLKNPDDFTQVFLRSLTPLHEAGRLAPILFQLPPNFKADTALLSEFLTTLPKNIRYAFEFRNPSWLSDPVYTILQDNAIALCVAESEKLEVPRVITAPFVYLRLRKPEYSVEERAEHARHIEGWLGEGRDVFCYFKHEDDPAGALYAEELLAKHSGDSSH
jgi:uncharacterized protein YecE (DUF72 family)